jgi:F-type H+-transporting ATPase subunit delta
MTSSIIRKYGHALVEVAAEQGKSDQVLAQLRVFHSLLGEHKDLSEVLNNPALPFSSKRTIVAGIAPQIPLDPIVANLVLILLKTARLKQFGEVVEAYDEALDEQRGVVRATVYSASGLDRLTRSRLESTLTDQTGHAVRLDYVQDKSLIGGIRVQVGSTVFDGSIRSQLEQIRDQLAGE